MDCTAFEPNKALLIIAFHASNGYEWLIGLQTLVWSSFFQVCIFLPVYICTEVRISFYYI
ncbi:hypothetical protein T07_12317 [Trichinella nelsoni]|uniref:Uncharacterized protein n=1 Tax=Trichinella nelsoni TaxID=6336 RepID=A0A0V0RD59_9BILA|nr:hypothetical protein T07_12317 [Trichinella nelsoni]